MNKKEILDPTNIFSEIMYMCQDSVRRNMRLVAREFDFQNNTIVFGFSVTQAKLENFDRETLAKIINSKGWDGFYLSPDYSAGISSTYNNVCMLKVDNNLLKSLVTSAYVAFVLKGEVRNITIENDLMVYSTPDVRIPVFIFSGRDNVRDGDWYVGNYFKEGLASLIRENNLGGLVWNTAIEAMPSVRPEMARLPRRFYYQQNNLHSVTLSLKGYDKKDLLPFDGFSMEYDIFKVEKIHGTTILMMMDSQRPEICSIHDSSFNDIIFRTRLEQLIVCIEIGLCISGW